MRNVLADFWSNQSVGSFFFFFFFIFVFVFNFSFLKYFKDIRK